MDVRPVRDTSETAPAWLVDAMLGRLARYLRFLGFDTEYSAVSTPEDLIATCRVEGRILVTRNRRLGMRADRGVVIRSVDLPSQLQELYRAVPSLPRSVRFDRCTLCNGVLHLLDRSAGNPLAGQPIPSGVGAVFVCGDCGHSYWEGSHTARVRRDVSEWLAGVP